MSKNGIELVMNCVKLVDCSILFNGIPQSMFNPIRRIKQGSPLSLYLFILCVESINSLLSSAEASGVRGAHCLRQHPH